MMGESNVIYRVAAMKQMLKPVMQRPVDDGMTIDDSRHRVFLVRSECGFWLE